MRTIPITAARDLGKAHGAEGVVILSISDDGEWGWTSWGRDRAMCEALGGVAACSDALIGEMLGGAVDRAEAKRREPPAGLPGVCPRCQGSGYTAPEDGGWDTCPDCLGTGKNQTSSRQA